MKDPQKIKINTTKELSLKLKVPPEIISSTLENKSIHYDVFLKRTAPDKLRIFYEADHVLKPIQDKLNRNILSKLQYPEEIKGGIINNSPSKNAEIHTGQKYVLTLDIKNFFPSVSPDQIQYALVRLGCAPEVASLITNIVSADKHLPQGFSTSPSIAAIILLEINEKIKSYLEPYGYKHSIWFDDLTISGSRSIDSKIISKMKQLFASAGFVIHKEVLSPAFKQQKVTGKVVNRKVSKSKSDKKFIEKAVYICEKIGIREYRRQYGKDIKGGTLTIRQLADHIGGKIGELVYENESKYGPLMKRWNSIREISGLLSQHKNPYRSIGEYWVIILVLKK